MQKNRNQKKTALNFVQKHPFVCCFNNLIKNEDLCRFSSYYLQFIYSHFLQLVVQVLDQSFVWLVCFFIPISIHYIHIYNIFIFLIFFVAKLRKNYFLFKVALISIEMAERSIFNFPAIVSTTTVVSAISATFP